MIGTSKSDELEVPICLYVCVRARGCLRVQQALEEEFARQQRRKFQDNLLQRDGNDSASADSSLHMSILAEQQRQEEEEAAADEAAAAEARLQDEAAERERIAELQIQRR